MAVLRLPLKPTDAVPNCLFGGCIYILNEFNNLLEDMGNCKHILPLLMIGQVMVSPR